MASAKRAATVAAVALLALGITAALAGANAKFVKKYVKKSSAITLNHPSDTEFAGMAKSKFHPCRNSRVVTLDYTDPVTGQTQPLSVHRTDDKGNYRVDLPQPAYGGSYQAKVARQNIRVRKANYACKAASSSSIQVQGPPLTP